MKRKGKVRRKKSRTGNGTSAVQWLYVLWNLPFIWVVKIGIGGQLKRRKKQVDKSAPGIDLIIFALPIPFAYQVEQSLHRICAPIRVKFQGSGHTERFLFPAAIPAIILASVVFTLSWGSILLVIIATVKSLA